MPGDNGMDFSTPMGDWMGPRELQDLLSRPTADEDMNGEKILCLQR
jgi:hypothetical protein